MVPNVSVNYWSGHSNQNAILPGDAGNSDPKGRPVLYNPMVAPGANNLQFITRRGP
jgi:hypothetical protein